MGIVKNFNEYLNESLSKEISSISGSGDIDSVVINYIAEDMDMYKITFDEMKRLIKLGYFNDDEWGQIVAIYDEDLGDSDGDNWNWIYIDDISDNDEFEMLEDYDNFFLSPKSKPSGGKLSDSDWVKLIELTVKNVHDGLRFGQSYMNALNDVNQELYNEITDTDNDPYYDDLKIKRFINFISK